MKKILLFVLLALYFHQIKASDFIESFNEISENYNNEVHDVNIIRPLNGGTVIIPTYDESCPEELKAPFAYACKIVEEYMPSCLPLNVKVSCGRINSSSNGSISKVLARSKENFGGSVYYKNAQMSTIKGVILAELCYNSSNTYLDYIPDVSFLTDEPDIEIVYNEQKLDDISFSLEPSSEQKYDFVSVAIRDLFIGLGLSSGYRINPITAELLNPSRELTHF